MGKYTQTIKKHTGKIGWSLFSMLVLTVAFLGYQFYSLGNTVAIHEQNFKDLSENWDILVIESVNRAIQAQQPR